MKKVDIVKFICIGGILTAFTVLFQSAPVFLPALGMAFSPFSTLPIAIAAVTNIFLGFFVLFTSLLILAMVSIQETFILLFTTGLLGIMIGIFLYRKGIIFSILISSIVLSLGIMSLTYIVGIPTFVDLTASLSTLITFFLFFSFSLIYASIWNIYFRKLMNYLKKIKFMS